jgi:transposase
MLRPAAVLVVRRMVTGRTATAMAPRQMTMMMGSAPAMGTASACAGRAFILFFCDSTTSALGGHV